MLSQNMLSTVRKLVYESTTTIPGVVELGSHNNKKNKSSDYYSSLTDEIKITKTNDQVQIVIYATLLKNINVYGVCKELIERIDYVLSNLHEWSFNYHIKINITAIV